MRQNVICALEICDEQAEIRAMSRGELEARQLEAERAQAAAPPDVSSQLRLTAQAEADAREQFADAQARSDEAGARGAAGLAEILAAERQRLEAGNERHERWADKTRTVRETGGKAKAELERRGGRQPEGDQAEPGDPQQQDMLGWWRQFEADAQAAERAVERERQAAVAVGKPWPPERNPRPRPEREPGAESLTTSELWRQFEADMAAVERSIECQHQAANDTGRPWLPERQPKTGSDLAAEAAADPEIEL